METLAITACAPMSPEEKRFIYAVKDPVTEVPVDLPCASLPKLHTLRLYNIGLGLEGVTDDTTTNPFPSLTSLKAWESPWVCPYLHMLTNLKQLSLSDMDFPTGNLMRAATALTQVTRLRLEWTGGVAQPLYGVGVRKHNRSATMPGTVLGCYMPCRSPAGSSPLSW